MPYGGSTKKEDTKIERCVEQVMKTGKSKESAIKICKSSIMKNEIFDFEPIDKAEFSKTLKGVEIFREGVFRGKKFTKKILQELVDNFRKLKESCDFDPPIRIGHRIDGRSDINARNLIGYVTNVYVEEDKDGVAHLYADSEIADDEAVNKIGKVLRKRSVELGAYEDNEGNVYKNVLWGYGFVDIPQVDKMQPFMAEVQMFEQNFDKELYSIEMEIDKKDAKSIRKSIDSLKILMDSAIKKEDYFRVQRIAEIISNLNSMLPLEEHMENEETKEEIKEEIKEDVEETKEEVKEEEKEKSDEGSEEITLSKEEHVELLEAKKKIEEFEKIEMEKEISERVESVNKFQADGKVISGNLDKEVEFVKGLTKEQFESYKEIKENQPKFIELDAEKGTQESTEKEEDKEVDPVELAKDNISMYLKEKGWADSEIEDYLKKVQ